MADIGSLEDPLDLQSFMVGLDAVHGGIKITMGEDTASSLTYFVSPLLAAQLAAFLVTAVEACEVAAEVEAKGAEIDDEWGGIPEYGHDDDEALA